MIQQQLPTLVKVSRPMLEAQYLSNRPWLIHDRFRARECTVFESEVPPHWFIWMGPHNAFFALAHWNGDVWTLESKTHDRYWKPIDEVALRRNPRKRLRWKQGQPQWRQR